MCINTLKVKLVLKIPYTVDASNSVNLHFIQENTTLFLKALVHQTEFSETLWCELGNIN